MPIGALVTIFGWAFLSFWSAIPAGIALGVAPAGVVVTATLAYGAGAVLVALVGGAIRERVMARIASKPGESPSGVMRLIRRAWDRFGLVGLALLAPLTVGSLIGAAIGLSLGAKPGRLVIALTIGAALWGAAIAVAIALGVMAVTPTPA